jgi:two-component sensor histidine kinase/DNA-binding response OmpR family regulator
MEQNDKVNILLVDDQPAKLLSYEVVLRELDDNLIKAQSATEALEVLLKNDVAVVLMDVCMPDLDGFELAAMIRDHPRFQRTAIIFISAIHLTATDYLRGYEMGGVDYVPVPVVPELLRAKVKVFAELYRKTRQLEALNMKLESRVRERTAELESTAQRLIQSEQRRSLALAAGNMGSWDWDLVNGDWMWDEGQCSIFGVDPATFKITLETVGPMIAPDDLARLGQIMADFKGSNGQAFQTEFRVFRSDGEMRWCFGTATPSVDAHGRVVRVSGVTVDITERKQTEERQLLLAREVDHRARNALAVVQAIVRLTRAKSQQSYVKAVEGRIHALAQAHTLLSETRWEGADVRRLVSEELAPYRSGDVMRVQIEGPPVFLSPEKAQNLALALHELATNSVKYGALSAAKGSLTVTWQERSGTLTLHWRETGGPAVVTPKTQGFGTKIMHASIKHQIGGDVVWEWHASGLRCTLQIPTASSSDIAQAAAAQRDNNLVQLPSGTLKRVLLAEDEAMIGMMMRDILVDYGLFVVGPCCTVSEALEAAAGEFDCAILDFNLGGEPIYPVATALAKRKVPFAFVTGYGRESIDSRFDGAPVLQKPVVREGLERFLREVLGVGLIGADGPNEARRLDPPAAIIA